ncbi:hypothetical protein GC173_08120 [bacterium]|nr:hypothetical protein [bacterium]
MKGQKVLAEYEHGAAASFLWLRELAVTFTAVEIARRFAYFQTAEGFQRFEQWEQSASLYLRDMQRQQRPGVDALERVPLLSDVRPNTWTKFFG